MLTVEHLSVDYFRRGTRVHAVQDVSFAVEPGQTVGLVGESGSGKSTVALAILRLIRPLEGEITSGRILFEGQDLLALPEEAMRARRGKDIAMIFQDPFTSLNPVLRVGDQLAEVFAAHGQGVDHAAIEEMLQRVQLDPARMVSAYPHQLSGGQRQRVMIAMALLERPKLLLADEPTTALDVLVQKEILELLFQLQKDLQLSVLFISHNLGLVMQHASRVLVMKSGRAVEWTTPSGLLTGSPHEYSQALLNAYLRLYRHA